MTLFIFSNEECKKTIKLSPNRPWRPIGLCDVKDPTLLDNRFIVNCEVLATRSSPVRTSQEAHSVSMK
jgi:hypothetical protein